MLEIPQLHELLREIEDADDTLLREALRSLMQFEEQEWAAVPAEVSRPVVTALKAQLFKVRLLKGAQQLAVQKAVVTILGNLGPRSKAALPQLIELLQEGVADSVREAAANALGKFGREAGAAVGPLVGLLSNSRPGLVAVSVRALGDIGCADARVRTALVGLWPSPPQLQAANAPVAIALCKLGIDAPDRVGSLTRTLAAGQEARVRTAAAEALGWCSRDETDVVPALLAASLKDTSEEVRRAAQAGLDRMRLSPEEAIRLCGMQLGASSYAEDALQKSGGPAVPALIGALGAKEPAIRLKAARTLGCLGAAAAGAAPALTEALLDGNPDIRLAAAKGLWNVTGIADAAVPALVHLLEGKGIAGPGDGEARRRFLQTVMEALGRMGPAAQAALPALTSLLKDKNRHIHESALSALRGIELAAANNAKLRPYGGRVI